VGRPLGLLASAQGNQCDFGRAVPANRNHERADAHIGIERQAIDLAQSLRIFARQPREINRPQQGEPNLPSVGVPGQLQIDRVPGGNVSEVWFVRKQDHRVADRNSRKRLPKVSFAGQNILYACKPQSSTGTRERDGRIAENLNANSSQGCLDVVRIRETIVVAKHRPHSVRSAETLQDMRTGIGLPGRTSECRQIFENRRADKVPRQHHQIGGEFVRHANGGLDRDHRKVGIVVEVTQLDDGETVELAGQATESNFDAGEREVVGLVNDCVRRDRQTTGGRRGAELQKTPSGRGGSHSGCAGLTV